MNILVLNAIRGRTDRLAAMIESVRSETIDAMAILGDLAAPGGSPSYGDVLDLLSSLNVPLYVIPGGHDESVAAVSHALKSVRGARAYLVHRSAAPLGAADVVAGFGGQLTTAQPDPDVPLQFPAWEARIAFEHLGAYDSLFQRAARRVLLFATPPRGATVDRDGTHHTGAALLNSIVHAAGPHLVCCGGPAEGRGVETINGTLVVNPGAVADGCYAIVDLDRGHARLLRLAEPLKSEPLQTIVVALDGSSQSWRAFELATSLARGNHARLVLVHAWDHVPTITGAPYDTREAGHRIAEGTALLHIAAALVPDLKPDCEVLEGPATHAILRVAEVVGANLIVMGARGRSPLRTLMGSVSNYVLQHALCPVLVTRQGPHAAELAEIEQEQLVLHS